MQLVMPFARSTSYEAADFIRGEANAHALDWVERWPDWPYSILLVHGPKGCGKTHFCHTFAARAGAGFIAPERLGSVPADPLLVGKHCWVLDGIGDVADHAALAQLINHVRARGDYLLLTARGPAPSLGITLPDLHSRLAALPSVAIGAPDDGLLVGVLAKQFADRQLRIAPEVLAYATSHLERSYEALAQFVRQVDGLSLARGKAITIPLIREVLQASAASDS